MYLGAYYQQAFTTIRDTALIKLSRALPDVRYLIVGANDGTRGDPLYHHTGRPNWRGTLFEPLPVPFQGLTKSYAGRAGATLRNQAVVADAPGGTRKFFNVPFSSTNSSFRRDVIVKHAIVPGFEDVEKRMVEIDVDCVAVGELAAEPGFAPPDVLLTDTEGYDFTLFGAWWALGWRPYFVEVEVIHLAEAERTAIRDALNAANYELFWIDADVYGLRRDAFPPEDMAMFKALRDQALATMAVANMLAQAQAKPA